MGQTDSEGAIDIAVDGAASEGVLELGEMNGEQFVPRLTMNVRSRPPGDDTAELAYRLRNLGWAEDEGRPALGHAVMRYAYRRTLSGPGAAAEATQSPVNPDWFRAANPALPENLQRVLQDVQALHDRRRGF